MIPALYRRVIKRNSRESLAKHREEREKAERRQGRRGVARGTRRGRRKRAWKRPFRPPRAFRRGEMARFSYRTDIRPVQEPRTKSYIHASSHYASLSRLGSAVRRAGRRRKKRGPAEDAASERKKHGERRGALWLVLLLYARGREYQIADVRGGSRETNGDCTLFTAVPPWRVEKKSEGDRTRRRHFLAN